MKLKFNYSVRSVKIKSKWFDVVGRKKSVYQSITYKGLNLYFQLFKFRLHGQEKEHTFMTSISMLRKETGYSTGEVLDLLKLLKSAKVIKLENVSRWEYLIDSEGEILDKNILVITASDTPITERKPKVNSDGEAIKNRNGDIVYIDFPVSDDDYYISVSFEMLKYYESKKLNERYYALYCLMLKYRNGYIDKKMNMRISKIAQLLAMDKDTIHRMIYQLNRNYLLASKRLRRDYANGYKFEHYLLTSVNEESISKFLSAHKDTMDRLIKRIDKKKSGNKVVDVEEAMDVIEETTSIEPKLAFGVKKAQTTPEESSPFDDVDLSEFVDPNDESFEELFG